MIGAAKLVDKVKTGQATLEGLAQVLEQVKSALVAFDPFFEILPGSKPPAAPSTAPRATEVFADDAPFVKEPEPVTPWRGSLPLPINQDTGRQLPDTSRPDT
jgi:hypothetical protein